ncbi:MAG: hypothetical protein IJC09_03030 [Clostridia bacterium]|nr:hypothetical protein [Clostridia bacterium]
MKKIIFLITAFFLCATPVLADDISVYVNDEKVVFEEQEPVIINERTMIPVRGVLEEMGKNVDWDVDLRSVTVSDNEKSVILTVGSDVMLIKEAEKERKTVLDTAPQIINDKTVLPIRALAEEFGACVNWLDSIRSVMITTDNYGDVLANEETYLGDTFRIREETITDCGNCFVLNNSYLFTTVKVPDNRAEYYAQIVNMIAEKVPEANVYNMLLIDSNEIYGPQRFYMNQKKTVEYIYSMLSDSVTPVRAVENIVKHADEKVYFNTDHHWTHRGAFYAWEEYARLKGFKPLDLETFEKADTDAFSGSFVQRMPKENIPQGLVKTETMERFLPKYDTEVTIYSDWQMTKKMGKVPLINLQNNTYSCFIAGDHPLTVIKSSVGNGKKLAIIKDSYANAFVTWAVNEYEYIYVIDVRGFKGGGLHISDFYNLTKFDDLIIESYPTAVENNDMRGHLLEMAQ